MFSDNFFKKVERKTNVNKETILSLADKLQKGNMKDETTLKEVINDLAKMTGREVSKEKEQKIIETIINELLTEVKTLNVGGVLQTNNFEINSSETTAIYETIFEIIYNLKDVNFILNIEVNNTYIKLKYLFDKNIKGLKRKLEELKLERITVIDEKNNEEETKLEVRILRGES